MTQQEQIIKKICRFTFFFSNMMDTVFIDSSSQIKCEFSHNQLPEPLEPHLGNVYTSLNLQELNSPYDVSFHTHSFRMNYISAPILDVNGIYLGSIVTGPFLLEEPTALIIQEVLFENKLSVSLKHIMTNYYHSLPLISAYEAKTIAEFLAFSIANIHSTHLKNTGIGEISYDLQQKRIIPYKVIKNKDNFSTDLIEKRYMLQNQMISAVEQGDIEKAEKLFHESNTSWNQIPDRIPNDPLRSRKNTTIIYNTLLRRAAEKGGLHPVYIDSISEKFAIQIENISTIQQISDLQNKMVHEYCEAVSRFSLKNFNHLIRKAIEFIRLNLDQDLSLEKISKAIHSSPFELSRRFKKETGQTITDFINHLRINEALSIMENENLSITNIAEMVGFNDVNYFTKVFKKIKGITPSKYRQK